MSARDRDAATEDLIARARRGALSRDEEEALAIALADSPELQTAYEVGADMDRATAVQAGDDELIARAADAAVARATKARRSRSGSRYVAAAVALLSVASASGIAAALFSGVSIPWPFESAPSEPAPAPAPKKSAAAHKPHKKRIAVAPAPIVTSAPVPVPAAIEPAEPALVAQSERSARGSAPDAAELFHDANAARRDGELARARRLYAQLIDRHPASDEAGVARVSLGKLLLAAGEARAAERQFRGYLAGRDGQLAEEALVGQAQSLGRLHHDAEERAAWQRLLQAHPNSVYRAQAEQRMAALSKASPTD